MFATSLNVSPRLQHTFTCDAVSRFTLVDEPQEQGLDEQVEQDILIYG